MQHVAIVGPSGSGKTTLARIVADRIGGTDIDLDALFHQPDWQPLPTPQFRAAVATALEAEPRWVVAGNYTVVLDLVHGGADTIVWLDLDRWRITARVARRSLLRVLRREELWNGNRERVRNLISRDPGKNVILWAWTSHRKVRHRYEGFASGSFWEHAVVHRVTTPAEVDAFVATLS